MKISKFIIAVGLIIAFALTAPLAMAGDHDHGSNGQVSGSFHASGWQGTVSGSSSSSTNGGSESATSAKGNGWTSNKTTNFGGGTAFAGGAVTNQGVTSTTHNNSWSGGTSVSHGHGNYTGGTDGGTGTNVGSSANGTWQAGAFGGSFGGSFSEKGHFGHH